MNFALNAALFTPLRFLKEGGSFALIAKAFVISVFYFLLIQESFISFFQILFFFIILFNH